VGHAGRRQRPDLETRVAILESKCKEKHCELSREILSYVASAVQSNVRELEGTLNKIIRLPPVQEHQAQLGVRSELISTINNAAVPRRT